jgi:hypothetical protein
MYACALGIEMLVPHLAVYNYVLVRAADLSRRQR